MKSMRIEYLAGTLVVAAFGLVSCGSSPLGDNKMDKRPRGEKVVNCTPKDHDQSSFLQIRSPDDPDCPKDKLPDVVVTPKDEADGSIFAATMTKAGDIFGPKVSALYGVNLELLNKFEDNAVNAVARKAGTDWQVEIFGGLQRVKGMTPDAVTLVLCHELGHLIGGFPVIKYKGDRSMSAEGNSDYFATQACVRRLWRDEGAKNAQIAAQSANALPKKLTQACRKQFKAEDDIQICLRSMTAIKDIQAVFKDTSLTTPSTAQVKTTQVEHPEFQCRIDTFIAGALCKKTWDFDRKFPKNKFELRSVSCMYADFGTSIYNGVRPRCWYQPKSVRKTKSKTSSKP